MTIECDALWSFVGNKGQTQQVWLALERDTQEIVGVATGAHDAATARQLQDSLPPVYRQCADQPPGAHDAVVLEKAGEPPRRDLVRCPSR